MLSYQHIYHAGNFADVHKHVVLLHAFLLHQRSAPSIIAIDAHGGEGLYDLQSAAAGKNKEYLNGVAKLADGENAPAPIVDVMKVIQRINRDKPTRFYPGSPELLRSAMRDGDQLIVVDKHPQAFAALKKRYAGDKRIRVLREDAYQAVDHAKIPRHALPFVLFDPAYESLGEWQAAIDGVESACRRRKDAAVLLWYPITAAREHESIARFLSNGPGVAALTIEFFALPNDVQRRLNGSGMCIINPPPGFAESIGPAMAWLSERLAVPQAPRWSLKEYR